MAETVDQRVERLSREMGVDTPSDGEKTLSPDQVEQNLNQDMSYQLSTGPDRVLKRKEAFARYGMEPPTVLSKPGTKEVNPEGPVHKYVRPALELGGMMGGAALGSAAGPLGGVAGGALGFAGGDTASSALERLAGERPPMQSVEQALGETGRAITGGGALEMGSRVVGRAAGAIGSKVLAPFSKQYEGANKTLDELAQSKGITLDPHEVIQNRPMSLGHKVLENIPFTSGQIQRNELKKLEGLTKEWAALRENTDTQKRQRLGDIGQKIQDTVEKSLDKIGMRQGEIRNTAREALLRDAGSPLTYKELGQETQQALKDFHEGKKGLENAAWDYARQAIPPDTRIPTTAMKETAKEIATSYQNIPSFLDEPLLRQMGDVAGSGNKKYDALVAQAHEQIPTGLPPAMRDKLLKEFVGNEKPGWRVEDLLKLRSELSSAIQEHHTGLQRGDVQKGSADVYGRVYTKLLKAVDQDLTSYSERQGTDLAERFRMARAASGERLSFFNPKDNPAVAKAIMADPAKLSSVLIKPGSAEGYTQLKGLAGQSATAPVKAAFTNQLLGVGGKEAEGLPALRRKLDQYGLQTLKEVYSPQEVKDLYHLANQSTWMDKSPIGNRFFRELVKTSPAQVAPTILGHPKLTGKVIRQFPEMRKDLRTAFVESIKPHEATPFPTKMLENLNAYPPEVQSQLFSKAELKDFYDMAQIVERTRGTVKLAENPSGTAQNLVTFATGGAVLKHPITMAPTVLTTTMLTKLYLSKVGRRYLLEGLVTPTGSSRTAYITSQILGVAGVDQVRDMNEQRRLRQGIPLDAGPRLENQP